MLEPGGYAGARRLCSVELNRFFLLKIRPFKTGNSVIQWFHEQTGIVRQRCDIE